MPCFGVQKEQMLFLDMFNSSIHPYQDDHVSWEFHLFSPEECSVTFILVCDTQPWDFFKRWVFLVRSYRQLTETDRSDSLSIGSLAWTEQHVLNLFHFHFQGQFSSCAAVAICVRLRLLCPIWWCPDNLVGQFCGFLKNANRRITENVSRKFLCTLLCPVGNHRTMAVQAFWAKLTLVLSSMMVNSFIIPACAVEHSFISRQTVREKGQILSSCDSCWHVHTLFNSIPLNEFYGERQQHENSHRSLASAQHTADHFQRLTGQIRLCMLRTGNKESAVALELVSNKKHAPANCVCFTASFSGICRWSNAGCLAGVWWNSVKSNCLYAGNVSLHLSASLPDSLAVFSGKQDRGFSFFQRFPARPLLTKNWNLRSRLFCI